jgi:hypothetical protein
MTNATEKKASGFVFPMPVDGRGDNEVALRQEASDPVTSPVGGLPLSITGYDYWRTAVEKGKMTPEALKEIGAAFDDIRNYVVDRMTKVPVPEGLVGTEHDRSNPASDKEPFFVPYLFNAGFSILSSVVAQCFPKHTVPERLAILSEITRCYAISAMGAYTQYGLNPPLPVEQSITLQALRTVAQPAPMSVIAQVVEEQRKVKQEAELRGVEPAQIYAERLKQLAGVEKLAGEPEDD